MRRFAVWLAMVAAFVGFLLARRGGLSENLPALALLGVFLTFLVALVLRSRRTQRLSIDGLALLWQGRYVEALAVFERQQRQSSRDSMAPHNRGVALIGLWRISEAAEAFAQSEKRSRSSLMANLAPMRLPLQALCSALLGSADAARAFIAQAGTAGLTRSPNVLLAQAVLAARDGQWSEVREKTGRYEVKLLGGNTRGLADALAAWSVLQLHGASRHVDRLGLFGEAGPDALKAVWPELAQFVASAPEV